jgi:hypothetical protein
MSRTTSLTALARTLPLLFATVGTALAQGDLQGDLQGNQQGNQQGHQRAAALTQPLVDTSAEPGVVWALGSDWKASFDTTGFTYIPRLGRLAPVNEELRFELARVTLAGEPLALPPGEVSTDGARVTTERGTLREVVHLGLQELEQTFVFEALPARGALAIEVGVSTGWTAVPGDAELRFVHETYGEVHYGRAFAFDATGRRIEIARTWSGSAIVMTVPASFVGEAVLPLTVDPLFGVRLVNGYGTVDDDSLPDIAYVTSATGMWFTWEDYTSASDTDVFASRIDASGSQSTVVVDASVTNWATPRVAASPSSNRLLVVASSTVDGPGTSIADIVGRLVDTAGNASIGAAFVIDQSGLDCVAPDAGGSWNPNPSLADFCVVWERQTSATNRDIFARVINADGTFETPMLNVAVAATDDDHSPAISPSRGDETLVGDYWNVAWVRDLDHDGRGTPYVHRIYLDGTNNGAVEQEVLATNLASNIDVSSTLDRTVPGTNERPFIVVFQRTVGPSEDILATVCTQSAVYTTQSVSHMEDFDPSLDSMRPRVATDGASFVLAYEEESWSNPADRDVYAVGGSVAYAPNRAWIALAERHVPVHVGDGVQQNVAVASAWDGSGASDDTVLVWEDRYQASISRITLQNYDLPTVDNSPNQAIGRQYCDANAHADSGDGGRRASFIHARGTASVGTIQELYCAEMRTNAAAYFIVSAETGNVNLAGGGQGRLCLGGAIGRVVGGQILNTGPSGSVSVTFNPGALPTPFGPVAAAPGQTFHFQCWHRDAIGGVPTSNFSNACSITFLP